jgi:hypothetical protein
MSSKGVEKMSRSSEEMDDEQLRTIDDLEMLGEDLVGKLRAINQYRGHVLVLENEEAVTTLEHIREEEKEHFAKLLGLIQRFDPAQADKL